MQLVKEMLSAKPPLAAARTDRDRTFSERKCEPLDRGIDRLVYELYGLTEEELRLVEEGIGK